MMPSMSSASHTGNALLSPGHWFCREGQVYEITRWDAGASLGVQARVHPGQTVQEFTLAELLASPPTTRFAPTLEALEAQQAAAAAAAPRVIDDGSLPSHLLKQADAIITAVETVRRHVAVFNSSAAGQTLTLTEWTRQGCDLLDPPIALSTYYKYRMLYDAHGGLRPAIAAALRRSTFGKTKLSPEQQHFVDTIVQSFYRTNPPMRLQTVYTIAEQIWQHTEGWWIHVERIEASAQAGLSQRLMDVRQPIKPLLADETLAQQLKQMRLPSRAWFYAYVKQRMSQPSAGAELYVTRYGQAEWEKNTLVFDEFASSVAFPLQYVFADHYKLDVLHVDDDFREPMGRLWLTVLIDAFSRAVLGMYLGYEDPCIESIQGALRHAIWPKSDLSRFGIEQAWATFGVPQRLFLDNAWAHLSYSLESLTSALASHDQRTRMELVFRPPYKARYGGLIERLFGNFAGQLRERLPGALLPMPQRATHDASKNACLLYRDIERILHQLMVDYLHTPHSALGMQTPHERWIAGLRLAAPIPPVLTPELERSFWRLYPHTRVANAHGISLFGMHFWNPALGALPGLDSRAQKRAFHVRYDPLDLSRLAVFEQGAWLGDVYSRELRLPDGSHEAVSLWELQLAKEWARAQHGPRSLRTQSWLIHILEARELIEQRQTESASIRRKVQQLRAHRQRPLLTGATEQAPADDPGTSAALLLSLPAQDDPRAATLKALKEML